jgi:osmotically-inducible protein OsmY
MDTQIKQEAEHALRVDRDLDATDIAVAVNHGVVSLTGFARSDHEKWQAADDVARLPGVAAVANDIEVRPPAPGQASDPELARQSAEEIRRELPYSHRFITLVVRSGWLTLEGEVEWRYQMDGSERAARRVTGLTGVSNGLRVARWVEPAEIKRRLMK